jgi:enoyl-CoA hydratase/carnithine racemase
MVFETLKVSKEGAVLFVEIAAPPMNLLGPELIRDLISLIERAEADQAIKVLVFKSADADYLISHVDVTKINEYREEAAKLTGPAEVASNTLRASWAVRGALEVMLSAEDYDAELAERYGWINRALPADSLGDFVSSLAHRIAGFPTAGHVVVKDRVNAIALAPVEDFRRDSDLFDEGLRDPEFQRRAQAALKRGFQTREVEIDLAGYLGGLADD